MRRSRGRLASFAIGVVTVGAVAVSCGTLPAVDGSGSVRADPPTTIRVVGNVWVNVGVATLWTSRHAPRPVDAPATAQPVDIPRWLASMTTPARRDLVGRVETQALYGERLRVIAIRGGWLRVVAPAQPSSRDSRGYPGWVPSRQVTGHPPVSRPTTATVIQPTAWLRGTGGARVLQLSIGTRLPVVGAAGSRVEVFTPTAQRRYIRSAAVSIHDRSAPAFPATRRGVVATARSFLGLPYLWGGRSGFAVDCSGLTELAYGVHGVTIPRDAQDQAAAGRSVSPSRLRPADLLVYGSAGSITHVAMYVGHQRMIEAPGSGLNVRVTPVRHPLSARRFL